MTSLTAADCRRCGGPTYGGRHRHCRRCYLALGVSTPLRRWREETGRDFRWLAAEAGIAYRTVLRVAAGDSPCVEVAARLQAVTGLTLVQLRAGRRYRVGT